MNPKTEEFDRLKVVLIDDEPETLCGDPFYRYEDSLGELKPFFDVRFLVTIEEAREFRDLSRAVQQQNPFALQSEGWVPEVIVCDYMLRGTDEPLEQRLPPEEPLMHISPLPRLSQFVKTTLIGYPPETEKFEDAKISPDEESYGCFAGGLLFLTFADHPCSLVTRTKRMPSDLKGTHTEFFQWLLENDFRIFTGKSARSNQLWQWLKPTIPKPLEWTDVLNIALPRLRDRLEGLAFQGSVAISLDDLMGLASETSVEALTIESCYGIRRFPVRGLFADYGSDQWQTEAQDWASHVLGALLSSLIDPNRDKFRATAKEEFGNYLRELKDAITLTEKLWEAYWQRDLRHQRYELASLAEKYKQGEKIDEVHLNELLSSFRHTPLDPDILKKKKAQPELDKNVCEIRLGSCSDMSKRLSALMMIAKLIEFVNSAEANRRRELPGSPTLSQNLDLRVNSDDVYAALFPLPKDPLHLPRVNDAHGWQKALAKLNDTRFLSAKGDYYRNLGVNIDDVLDGEEWRESDNGPSTHGIRPTERQLLQWYLLSAGKSRLWNPRQGQAKDVLYGKVQ
jgi:hypothetical protein